jgi:predicted nucleotidyltransferase
VASLSSSLNSALLDLRREPQLCLVEGLLRVLPMGSSDEITIESLIRAASSEFTKRTPDGLFAQIAARKAYVTLFRRFEGMGLGECIVGRKGHQTRFRLTTVENRERMIAAIEHDYIPRPTESLAPILKSRADDQLSPSPRQTVDLSRATVVAQLRAHSAQLRSYGIESLKLFGSMARDEARPESDIDLLAAFKDPVTSDGFFGAKFFLEDLLARRIDLVTDSSLREPIRRAIESDLVDVT